MQPKLLEAVLQMPRKLSWLFILVAIVPRPVQSSAQTWAEYRPEGIGYSLEMPGEWTLTVDENKTAVGPVKSYTALVDQGTRAYMSMYSFYPPEKVVGKPVTPLLDGARDGAVTSSSGKLRSEQRIVVSNLPAREIIIDTPQKIVLVLRYTLMQNTLIQAIVAGQQGVELEPNTKRFLGSLKIVNP
jgi:hypothetical protein